MNNLNSLIVDDEGLARRGLALRLQQIPEVDVIAECSNGSEALKAINDHHPDLVFLDIQMPGMSGFELVSKLQADNMPMIIFVTAFDEYAIDAFNIHAVDYVLKPIDDDRLHEAIDRAVSQRKRENTDRTKERLMDLVMGMTGASATSVEDMLDSGQSPAQWPEKLSIKDGGDVHLVKVADIEWVDAAGDYMCIHAAGQTHIMRVTMKQLEKLLNPVSFLRIHRSTIVSTDAVSGAQSLPNGEYLLTLESGSQVKASRGYREQVRNALQL